MFGSYENKLLNYFHSYLKIDFDLFYTFAFNRFTEKNLEKKS